MTKKQPEGWFYIGEVGVDSGQLMVCDPCYILSQWKGEGKSHGRPPVVLTKAGLKKFPKAKGHFPAAWPFEWGSYDSKCPHLGGISINDAMEKGYTQHAAPPKPTGEFSYGGICDVTCSDESAGQLKFDMGHDGVAVAFSSGYGDGVYRVMGRRNADGRIVEVRIVMGEEE